MTSQRQSGLRLASMRAHNSLRAVAVILCGLLALVVPNASVFAAGAESMRRANDLVIAVDSRWAGGANGGYYPIRIRLTNTSAPRTLEFRFVDNNNSESSLPTVERRILIDQNATLQFTLSVPLVSYNSSGELRVYEKGRHLEQFSQHLSLPDTRGNAGDRPALLVIHPSPATVDCGRFEEAVQSLVSAPALGGAGMVRSMGGVWAGGAPGAYTNDSQVIAPTLLPESWIDYTALDLVAIPLATLDKLPAAARNALLQWTEAGGTLLVTEVGEPAASSRDLARLLELASRPAAARDWIAADPGKHTPIVVVTNPATGAGAMPIPAAPAGTPVTLPPEQKAAVEQANHSVWSPSEETFRRIDLMHGHVFAFRGNPFPGAPIDWAWWMKSADWSNTVNWTARFGNSTRERHPGFFEFLVPGVGAVPVVAFVLLISLFALIIGPVNYFIVLRRKQLYLLVVTIPVIALVTSFALFSYAMIADGFRVQSRLLSFTLLDQGTKRAVSLNRISLFAGIAPSQGLQFSPETAVFPIWSSELCFEGGTIDWTDSQALVSGWLRSRTRTQFETIEHRIERGRVEFKSAGERIPPEASNGLEWAIGTLIVRDEAGNVYSGREIPAGGSLQLRPLDSSDVEAMRAAITDFPLLAPPGAEIDPSALGTRRGWRGYGYGSGPPITFAQSLLQRSVQQFLRPEAELAKNLAPRSYLATFRENPGIELGVEKTLSKSGVHLLMGFY